MKFFGHVIRADGMDKQLLCSKICGMKSRRRQHTNYTGSLNFYITKKELPKNELIRIAANGGLWSPMSGTDLAHEEEAKSVPCQVAHRLVPIFVSVTLCHTATFKCFKLQPGVSRLVASVCLAYLSPF